MELAGNIRLSIRRLAAERGIAVAAILTLAIGIAGCTAMFAIVRAVLLRSMGIAAPEQLVMMWPSVNATAGEFSYATYVEARRRSASFDGVALIGSTTWPIPMPIDVNGRRAHVTQSVTSGNFFDVLGARPSLGRTFADADDRPTAPPVVVLSDRFWRANFGEDVHVIGRRLGEAEIIGVMPPDFFYPAGADIWTPAARALAGDAKDKSPAELTQIFDSVGAFHLIGRPKPDISPAAIEADITRAWVTASSMSGAGADSAKCASRSRRFPITSSAPRAARCGY